MKGRARFAIGETGSKHPLSEVWSVTVRGSDVYASSASYRGTMKLSLHQSGVCHLAYSKEFFDEMKEQFAPHRSDRTIHRWRRPDTPEAGPLPVASIAFAAFEKWELSEEPAKDGTVFIPPPPDRTAVVISFVYSRQDPDNHCGDLNPSDVYIARLQLANGDYLTLLPSAQTLSDDFFDFRPVARPILMIGVNPHDTDHRGVSVFRAELYEQGIVIWSLHNMRLMSVPRTDIAGRLARLKNYLRQSLHRAVTTLRRGRNAD